MPTTTASDEPSAELMVDALFAGLRSGDYWMSVSVNGDTTCMHLFPTQAELGVHQEPYDRKPLAVFSGTRDEVMAQFIAYRMQERLS